MRQRQQEETAPPSQGILTFAFGLNYQKQAYLQALSAKKNLGLPTTVVVGHKSDPTYFKKLEEVANVVEMRRDCNKFEYESHALRLTPYDITFKTDADVVFPAGSSLYHGSVPAASGVACDILGAVSNSIAYRKIESSLGLPTIYSACFSFDKRTPEAKAFYEEVESIYQKWYRMRVWTTTEEKLPPTTDSIYSFAWAKVFGLVRVDGNEFLHAKPEITAMWTTSEWTQDFKVWVDDNCRIFLDGIRITKPFHYYDKSFASDELIKRFEDVCLVRETESGATGRRKQRKAS